jgi:hypothetical protein
MGADADGLWSQAFCFGRDAGRYTLQVEEKAIWNLVADDGNGGTSESEVWTFTTE